MDVNGDGFLDFVEVGSTHYLKNDGGGNLVSTPWFFGGGPIVVEDYSDQDKEDIENSYYREDPLRRWSAYRSGVVLVDDEISYAEGAEGSSDGASGEIHVPGENDPDAVLTQLTIDRDIRSAARSTSGRHEVGIGDPIYFRLNPKDDERGDRVKWRSRIRYESIALFEDMEFLPVLTPPAQRNEFFFATYPNLRPLYSYQDKNISQSIL